MHIHYVTVSVGQEPRNNLARSYVSESLTGYNLGVLGGLQSPRRPTGKDLLPSSWRWQD